jgi:hypothetical protein
MNDQILSFFNTLDELLAPFAPEGKFFDMYHLGRSALVLHFGFGFSTNDIDVVGLQESALEAKAIELLGKDTLKARALGLYLDLVPRGLPPVPAWFKTRSEMIPGPWKTLRLWKLEIHDLAVTKLKSFRAKDREDLQEMCDRGLLQAEKLRQSFDMAFQFVLEKDDEDNPAWAKARAGLRRVESYLEGKIRSL